MKFITNRDVKNKDVPIGWRELTEEELTVFFKDG